MIKYLIGIDPGRNSGICVYNRTQKKIHELQTLTFWETVKFLGCFRQYMGGLMEITDEFKVIIEDPQLNSFAYARHGKNDLKVQLDIAHKVGRNKENAYLLMEWMKENGVSFTPVRPTSSKWKAEYFNKITRWTGKSNEHTRDAARLLLGR